MKTLILLTHPNLKESKINKTLTQSIQNTPNITLHDLYATYSDGKINASKEIELLKTHDKIVFEFPLFWFSSPSLLKEYEDVVFSGVLYGSEPKMLQGKIFQIITSAGSPEEKYRSDGRNQKNLEEILLPFQMSASYLGMQTNPIFCVYNAMNITDASLAEAKEAYKKLLLS
ncbi:hypothetical protein BKH41_01495 [Helicobacter sp. 12S02232-10]|uniref:NAD(P)H-dependent oxidoreductase n=1 Tax=Helicobacter sp. 12S02232-10 TaxID=1476197 RepID=UPI000BCD84DD|nr:NAD(P)H-dependent oxidoreductase [Helicobacter sp. 12S02232-10]PAF49997.1 hypothetical protein BKH41_01495 [Helicobacter sp. 12S02232-10]